MFWLTVISLAAGLAGSYFFYYNTDEFIPNTVRTITFASGWNGKCVSTTVSFFVTVLEFSLLPFVVYRSSPWKEPFYRNIPLMILVIVNIALITVIYFWPQYFAFLDLKVISRQYAGIIYGITLGVCGVSIAVGRVIEKAQLHQNIVE